MSIKEYLANGVKDFQWGPIPNQLSIKAESVTDGYHTIDELYDHRRALTIALFTAWFEGPPSGLQLMKSKLHTDGTMFDGYFIVVADIPEVGQISYHYEMKYWDKFIIPEVERIPYYDGHTSQDVVERLMKL